MEPLISQQDLSITFTTPLGADVFIIDEVEGFEALSECFEFIVQCHSTEHAADFNKLLGNLVTITVHTQTKRYINGIVGKIEQHQTFQDANNTFSTNYTLHIYPKLWTLKFSKDCQIFQDSQTLDIVQTVLKTNQVSCKMITNGSGSKRPYCVQYNESYYDFVCRLLEEEGFYFYFTHEESSHMLVIADQSPDQGIAMESPIELTTSEPSQPFLNVINTISFQSQVVPASFATCDFNYLTPAVNLLTPDLKGTTTFGGRVYEYPGEFTDIESGNTVSKTHLEEIEWPQKTIQGGSTVIAFSSNTQFKLTGHLREDLNQSYLIYKVQHKFRQKIAEQGMPEPLVQDTQKIKLYENKFWAFPASVPFRPMRKVTKPKIHSQQTAIVTGSDHEEILVDKFGRIKIKFFWDQYNKPNDKSSCWVRVTQTWAGNGFGAFITPRMGMEVVVSFMNGNPDHPLVVGCVYNGKNTPPPDSVNHPTRSIFATRSSLAKDDEKKGGYNELYFDDDSGREEIFFHAQKDFNTVIESARNESINKKDDTLTIFTGNKLEFLLGKDCQRLTKINTGDHNINIAQKGNVTTSIKEGNKVTLLEKGDCSLTLSSGNYLMTLKEGNINIKVEGDLNLDVSGSINMKAGNAINMQDGSGLNIKSDASIRMKDSTGLSIQSDANIQIKDSAGLSIQSDGSIRINDSSGLSIQSGASISMKDSSGLSVTSGNSVDITANMNATVNGTMNAILTGGVVTVKGDANVAVKGTTVAVSGTIITLG